jgi:hypothetical protein
LCNVYFSICIICIICIIIYFLIIFNRNNIEPFTTKYLYINLNNRLDRKLNIKNQLNLLKINPKDIIRISGEKRKVGHYGCALSHIKALKYLLDNNIDYVFIFEDDFMWKYSTKKTENVLKSILKLDNWDVCLLACNGKVDIRDKHMSNVISCQTTSGYIVRKHYVPVLLTFWEHYIKSKKLNNIKFRKGMAIDQTWKILQKKDRWICVNPILGKQIPSYSDIEKHNV